MQDMNRRGFLAASLALPAAGAVPVAAASPPLLARPPHHGFGPPAGGMQRCWTFPIVGWPSFAEHNDPLCNVSWPATNETPVWGYSAGQVVIWKFDASLAVRRPHPLDVVVDPDGVHRAARHIPQTVQVLMEYSLDLSGEHDRRLNNRVDVSWFCHGWTASQVLKA